MKERWGVSAPREVRVVHTRGFTDQFLFGGREAPMGGRYVGIDLHRRRSVIYTMDADGERLDCVRIANDRWVLLEEVAKAGSDAEVVIEATYGWYWAVDLLQEAGFSVHLSHPSGNDWGKRRVKNDERDARDLADLLRLGRLAEAWIAAAGDYARLGELVALPGQARAVAVGAQSPGARGDGQGGRVTWPRRHVRASRATSPRRDGTRRRVHGAGRIVAGSHHGL